MVIIFGSTIKSVSLRGVKLAPGRIKDGTANAGQVEAEALIGQKQWKPFTLEAAQERKMLLIYGGDLLAAKFFTEANE